VAALERLWRVAHVKPAVLQTKFDALHPGYQQLTADEQRDVVGWAHAHGMAVVGYATLSGWPNIMRAVDDPIVRAEASACGHDPAAVLLRHALQHGVGVIPSSADPTRLAANRDALTFSLDTHAMTRLDGLAHLLTPVRGAPTFRTDAYRNLLESRAMHHNEPHSDATHSATPGDTRAAERAQSACRPAPHPPLTNDPERPYPSFLVGGSLPRVRYDDPAAAELLRRGLPVVLTHCPLVTNLVDRWSFEYLAAAAGPFKGHPVHRASWATSQFNYFAASTLRHEPWARASGR
jgi:hypothetical protein